MKVLVLVAVCFILIADTECSFAGGNDQNGPFRYGPASSQSGPIGPQVQNYQNIPMMDNAYSAFNIEVSNPSVVPRNNYQPQSTGPLQPQLVQNGNSYTLSTNFPLSSANTGGQNTNSFGSSGQNTNNFGSGGQNTNNFGSGGQNTNNFGSSGQNTNFGSNGQTISFGSNHQANYFGSNSQNTNSFVSNDQNTNSIGANGQNNDNLGTAGFGQSAIATYNVGSFQGLKIVSHNKIHNQNNGVNNSPGTNLERFTVNNGDVRSIPPLQNNGLVRSASSSIDQFTINNPQSNSQGR